MSGPAHQEYPNGSKVRHKKSGGIYTILALGQAEATLEPQYAYQGQDGRTWFRSKDEMEDGRFESLNGGRVNPPPGLLMSMAIRFNHALAIPGHYNHSLLRKPTDPSHARVLESTLPTMRQLWEEVAGVGFYSPEKEASYQSMRDSGLASTEVETPEVNSEDAAPSQGSNLQNLIQKWRRTLSCLEAEVDATQDTGRLRALEAIAGTYKQTIADLQSAMVTVQSPPDVQEPQEIPHEPSRALQQLPTEALDRIEKEREKFIQERGIKGMPKDKQRLAMAAWESAISATFGATRPEAMAQGTLNPEEIQHLVERHTLCTQLSAQSDDFGGERYHRDRASYWRQHK